jgi:ribonucleotide monophosphatase NagD (HAD superfamily)
LWNQIRADVFGHPVQTLTATEGGIQGAAILAGVGAGWVGDNLLADIAGGAAAGARTALLLSGATTFKGPAERDEGTRNGSAGAPRPDFVFSGLPELSAFLRESWAL